MNHLIPKEEIVCHSEDSAYALMRLLLREGYVVMLSREEQLYIINYIWSHDDSNRNDVVFMDRDVFEDEYFSSSENV